MGLTILEGSTFCICDEIGDLDGRTSGLFAEDTRFLSRLELRIDGSRPLLLSSGKVEYFSAAFYLRNPVVPGGCRRTRSRSRASGSSARGCRTTCPAQRERRAALVRARARGRHRLRGHHHGQGARLRARPSRDGAAAARRRRRRASTRRANQLVLEEAANGGAKTQVLFSQPGEVDGSRVRFAARARAARAVGAAGRRRPVAHGRGSRAARGRAPLRRGARPRARLARGVAPARAAAPHRASDDLRHSFSPVGRRPRRAADAHGRRASGCCPRRGCRGS